MADRVELQRRLEKTDRQVGHIQMLVYVTIIIDNRFVVSPAGGISYSSSRRLDCAQEACTTAGRGGQVE